VEMRGSSILEYIPEKVMAQHVHPKIFDEFQSINILVFQQTCVVVVRYYNILQNKTIYMKTHYDCQRVYC
jgi:hypothetical protein